MGKRQRTQKNESESLIPSLKTEEKHLEELLEQARGQATRIISEAEAAAAAHMASVESALPDLTGRLHESRIASLEEKAEEVRRAARAETEKLERDAAERLSAAVAFIVSRVWPGGRR